jgi:hypothetical protein
MIHDLSETLRTILTQPGLPLALSVAQVLFDRPVAQFNPQQSAINLFLFDIRENAELRNNEPIVTRLNGQATIRHPPMRVDCSYLVTAWIVGGAEIALQEHLLLSQVLQVLARYPIIPEPFLQGSLKPAPSVSPNGSTNPPDIPLASPVSGEELPPIPMRVAVPLASRQSPEFWTSLGIPVRACLVVTATIAIDINDAVPTTLPLATSHTIGLRDIKGGSSREQSFQIGGQISLSNRQPVVAAKVMLLERNQATQTDQNGLYQFSLIPAGTYTLQVQQSDGVSQRFPMTVPALNALPFDLQLN